MSKKRNYRNPRNTWKHKLLKYGPLVLFLPAWLITPPNYVPVVTSILIFCCYIYLETFNWIDNRKTSSKEKCIFLLARFWRYGYIAVLLAIMLLSHSEQRYKTLISHEIMLYGAYTIIIALSMCHHFICGMQDASHQPMNPYMRKIPRSTYRRDGLLIGSIFLILGIFGLAVI